MLTYDEALERALEAFQSAHPTETLPPWFRSSAFREVSVSVEGIRLRYYAQPASPLGANQTWEKTAQGIVLMEVDPVTRERRVVISRDVPKQIILFWVVVDPVSGNTTVLEDRDISAISDHEIEGPKGPLLRSFVL